MKSLTQKSNLERKRRTLLGIPIKPPKPDDTLKARDNHFFCTSNMLNPQHVNIINRKIKYLQK